MRRADGHFCELARLQRLAMLDRRRDVTWACAETDRCEGIVDALTIGLDRAESEFATLRGGGRFCLSRFGIAAALVIDGEDRLTAGRVALVTARFEEDRASAAWLQARFRSEWFANRDRQEARKAGARRADAADAEARAGRIVSKARAS